MKQEYVEHCKQKDERLARLKDTHSSPPVSFNCIEAPTAMKFRIPSIIPTPVVLTDEYTRYGDIKAPILDKATAKE